MLQIYLVFPEPPYSPPKHRKKQLLPVNFYGLFTGGIHRHLLNIENAVPLTLSTTIDKYNFTAMAVNKQQDLS